MPRYLRFLPIAFVALVLQIVAPVAACWAVGLAVSGPLQSAGICHDSATTGQSDQSGDRRAHDGFCAICCVTHAGALADAPKPFAVTILASEPYRVIWPDAAPSQLASRGGSNTQARAPPQVT